MKNKYSEEIASIIQETAAMVIGNHNSLCNSLCNKMVVRIWAQGLGE